jgi:hypothetical protein
MLWIISRRAIEHVKNAFVIDHPWIAYHEILPSTVRVRAQDWIVWVFFELHEI